MWSIIGASHHISNDQQTPSLHSDYGGPDDIVLDDGHSFPITHIGSTFLSSKHHNFTVNNFLCASSIAKNLLYVSQFCYNLSSIEFFPNVFLVKDLTMGASLVCSQNNGYIRVLVISAKKRDITCA